MWYRLAKIKVAQSLGGLGPPGGGQFYGFSLSPEYGGPRWYPMQEDDNLEKFIKEQTRYNPSYVAIGEAAEPDTQGKWETVAEIEDPFFGKSPSNLQVIVIPDGKEKTCLLLLDQESNEFRIQPLDDVHQDIAKQLKNWEFMLVPHGTGNKWTLLGRLKNAAGTKKGIFELNGKPSAPGFAYIWRDGPSASPSNNPHGDLTSNLWENWRSVDAPNGMVGLR